MAKEGFTARLNELLEPLQDINHEDPSFLEPFWNLCQFLVNCHLYVHEPNEAIKIVHETGTLDLIFSLLENKYTERNIPYWCLRSGRIPFQKWAILQACDNRVDVCIMTLHWAKQQKNLLTLPNNIKTAIDNIGIHREAKDYDYVHFIDTIGKDATKIIHRYYTIPQLIQKCRNQFDFFISVPTTASLSREPNLHFLDPMAFYIRTNSLMLNQHGNKTNAMTAFNIQKNKLPEESRRLIITFFILEQQHRIVMPEEFPDIF